MTERELFEIRKGLVQAFLLDHEYDGILISRADNYAMATGGKRNYINTYSDKGANSLFISKEGGAYFVGNTIESPRQMAEELGPLRVEERSFLWFEGDPAATVCKEFAGALVSDDGALGENVNSALLPLRALLSEAELEKYRRIGKCASEAMEATLAGIEAGMPEAEIAARLVSEGLKRRCQVPVALVAADERIAQFRHPLPTEAPLLGGALSERAVRGYVMVVGCFQKEGLVVSLTRFKRTGALPGGAEDAYARICAVDAVMQEATGRGATLGDVFAECQRAYAAFGFAANEWHHHHQGGATGYGARTAKGAPGEPFPALDTYWSGRLREVTGIEARFGAAFAWNPSAPGVKSEDTFLLGPDGRREIVTETPGLPRVDLPRVLGRDTEVVKYGIA